MSDFPLTQTIESQDLNLDKIFSDFYIVPNFQREYVWQEAQVDQLLEDVFDAFSEDVNSEYFIGSLVVCSGSEGTLELIDGQQRMTTTFILLCAIRDYLKQHGSIIPDKLISQIKATHMSATGDEIPHYRVSLLYEDSHDILVRVAESDALLEEIAKDTKSITNIVNAYDTIKAFLISEFKDNVGELRRFYAYFINRVKLVRIKTQSITHALKVFETVNDRGVGLDSMDLLKNLLFIESDNSAFDKLKNIWKELVDTLYKVNEKPLRFLRYFIFANFDVDRLKEDEIYVWFVNNADLCGYKNNPVNFAITLRDAAKAYAYFVSGQNRDGSSNRYLNNLTFLSGAARQHLILLLAANKLPISGFIELSRQIENLFFAYIITREPTKEFERRFAQWAKELRQISNQTDLLSFVQNHFQPSKNALSQRFELAFRELRLNSIQKYRMRYILGKLAQYINEQAYGESEIELKQFIGNRIHIEHILPQTPSPEILNAFDKPYEIEDYIQRLGNLTPLESSINSSIGNGLFSFKREPYAQSRLLLTKTIAAPVNVGKNTVIDRAVRPLITFDEWNSRTIDQRQEMLSGLAKNVWEMP